MKIALIGHKRVPSRSGGVEVVVETLAKIYADMGHEVTIYNRHAGEDKVKEYCGARVVEIPTFKNSKLNAMVYSFFAALRASLSGCDVIHFHSEGPCAMIPIAKLFKKRCIATVHGLDWQRSKWGGFATKYLKFGEKMLAKHADEVIVLSLPVQDYFLKTYGRKTNFIPNGTQKKLPVAAEMIKEKFGLEKDGYILFLARITPEKGLDYLIDAYKNIKTDKKLVVAGAVSPETDYIRSVKSKAQNDKRIIFTGFASGKMLDELFSNCFVYVLPSDIEGMPMSLLEAVGFGARCLVSDIDENTQIAPDYFYSFKKGSSESLQKQLEFMLQHENEKDCNFGKFASKQETATVLEKTAEKYDWNTIAKKTLALYTKNK